MRLLGRIRVNAATFREGYYGSSGELLRQIGRITGNIGSAYIIIIGEIIAAKGRECSDKRGESLGAMGIYPTE